MEEEKLNEEIKLSIKRSKLALDRTVLANTRTFNAWIRTGLAIVLAGLAIVGFIGEIEFFSSRVVLLALIIGYLFIVIGIFIYMTAYITYKNNLKKLEIKNLSEFTPLKYSFIVTVGMTTTALLIALLLLFLQNG